MDTAGNLEDMLTCEGSLCRPLHSPLAMGDVLGPFCTDMQVFPAGSIDGKGQEQLSCLLCGCRLLTTG